MLFLEKIEWLGPGQLHLQSRLRGQAETCLIIAPYIRYLCTPANPFLSPISTNQSSSYLFVYRVLRRRRKKTIIFLHISVFINATSFPKFLQVYPSLPKFPQVSPNFPQVSPVFPYFPQVSSSLIQFPPISSGFLRFPQVSSGFLRFPQVSSGFLRFPPLSSTFLKLPQVSACFCKFPLLTYFFQSLQ